MDIYSMDIDRFCEVILEKVRIGILTGSEAIEFLQEYGRRL